LRAVRTQCRMLGNELCERAAVEVAEQDARIARVEAKGNDFCFRPLAQRVTYVQRVRQSPVLHVEERDSAGELLNARELRGRHVCG